MDWPKVATLPDAIFSKPVLQYLCSYRSQGLIINSKSKIVVGITQRIDKISSRAETRDALDQSLVRWLVDAGFFPITVPNILEVKGSLDNLSLNSWLEAIQPGALILSGGNDIGDYPARDHIERSLLTWAEVNHVPVLGICRGLQMMAVWAGGCLVNKEGHVKSRHQLVTQDSDGEWPSNVNSYHNFGLESCPKGFKVAAQAEDGSIEAIQHIELPWEGWMWHPERETPFCPKDSGRLKRLINGQ